MRPRIDVFPRTRGGAAVRREMAAAVEYALDTFHGKHISQVPPHVSCDERVWAHICWRIGVSNFVEAIYCCEQDINRMLTPMPTHNKPRYFQAYLNRHFPEGGAR